MFIFFPFCSYASFSHFFILCLCTFSFSCSYIPLCFPLITTLSFSISVFLIPFGNDFHPVHADCLTTGRHRQSSPRAVRAMFHLLTWHGNLINADDSGWERKRNRIYLNNIFLIYCVLGSYSKFSFVKFSFASFGKQRRWTCHTLFDISVANEAEPKYTLKCFLYI